MTRRFHALALLPFLAGCPAQRVADRGTRPEPRETQPARTPDVPSPRPPDPAPSGEEQAIPKLFAEVDQANQLDAYAAALELLGMRAQDRVLKGFRERLNGQRPELTKTLVQAAGRYPSKAKAPVAASYVRALAELITPFLGSADPDLRAAAVDALAALDRVDPDDGPADSVAALLQRYLDASRERGPTVAERVSAVRVIGRKPPQRAVEILKSVFESPAMGQIAELRDAVRQELRRVTGRSFTGPADLRDWWLKNQGKTQDQWYQERIAAIDKDLADAREAARTIWRRYIVAIASLQDSADRVFSELKDSLAENPVPQIRVEAAKEILKTGRAEAYDLVCAALQRETSIEARTAMLEEAISKLPPSDPQTRARVAEQLLRPIDLTSAPEKEVRLAAVAAMGDLRAEGAIPSLLARLQNKNRDSEVAAAVLKALTKIGAPADGRFAAPGGGEVVPGRELNDFFQRELDRKGDDPLRDVRLIEECAGTLGGLQWGEASVEAERACALLVRLISWNDVQDPRTPARVRGVAVYALKLIKRPGRDGAVLKALIAVLKDLDDQVASEAARAIGEIAAGKLSTPKDREGALRELQSAFDGSRAAVKDAALDAIRAVMKADPQNLALLDEVAARLAKGKDYGRIVRLLKELPPRLGPEAVRETRAAHTALRATLADAYENTAPPDLKAAVEIWSDLAREDADRWGERHAGALFALPSEEADRAYADLIKRKPAEAPRFWQQRVALARRFVEIDRRKAREILDRLKADAALPAALRADLADLDRQVGGEGGAIERTLPASGGRPPAAGGAGDGGPKRRGP